MNRAFLGAYRKGREAFRELGGLARCPYPDWRNNLGGCTFSRTFRRYWKKGLEDEKAGLPMRYPANGGEVIAIADEAIASRDIKALTNGREN